MKTTTCLGRMLAAGTGALALALSLAGQADAAIRHYWIAAVPRTWDVVPTGRDPIMDMTYTKAVTRFPTVVYQAFTPYWRAPLRNRSWLIGDNDGIPGPLIRARVGDTVLVHFKNLDRTFSRPHSMHFHGFRYAPSSDGAYVPGVSTGRGTRVQPGQTFTYRLHARPGSAGVWPYHDHSPSMTESIAGGMYGAVSILAPRERRADKEFVTFFMKTNGFMTINGRAFVGNTPVPRARVGDVVQWDVLALGDDFHTFHIHGHRWRFGGRWIDTQAVGPAESFRIRFREDARGTWLYHCHVESHMMGGMIGLYKVSP